ncbi:glycosyltransferase family 4 protein [bacterium]|nr:glycosyltransferase family 4 protein [bacterium]MBT7037323.1 glycosyltransferase family 4 protein [bacterium]
MKIAIDCADLDNSRIDGTRVYIKQLLDWFGKLDRKNKFLLYHRRDFNELLKPNNFKNYTDKKIPPHWWWTQTVFAADLRYELPDICWMPIQQVPFIGPKKTKYVVTIHDLAFKFFPAHFPKTDLYKLNFFTDSAIKRADKIIAISDATKKDILKLYPKVNEKKIFVIHHGFDVKHFLRRRTDEEILRVRKELKIANDTKRRYLLYVGALQPRKNLITLIKAFEVIKKNKKFNELRLVLAGEQAWMSEETIVAAQESVNKKDIILTDRVDFEQLAALYQSAEIFVYPSLYEGFGIPILEGLASRVPVVTANNSSLPEVGGDAVELFESENHQALADVLLKIMKSYKIKERMIKRGASHVKKFSWEKSAKKTLEVLMSE